MLFDTSIIDRCRLAAMAEGSTQKASAPRDAPIAEPLAPEAANLATLTAARDGSQKDLSLALELAPTTLHARDSQGTSL